MTFTQFMVAIPLGIIGVCGYLSWEWHISKSFRERRAQMQKELGR